MGRSQRVDQHSEAYKRQLAELCKEHSVVPAGYLAEFVERVIRPYSDCFWHEGYISSQLYFNLVITPVAHAKEL